MVGMFSSWFLHSLQEILVLNISPYLYKFSDVCVMCLGRTEAFLPPGKSTARTSHVEKHLNSVIWMGKPCGGECSVKEEMNGTLAAMVSAVLC